MSFESELDEYFGQSFLGDNDLAMSQAVSHDSQSRHSFFRKMAVPRAEPLVWHL